MHRLAMMLQREGELRGVRFIRGHVSPDGDPEQFLSVVYEHAIVEHGHIGRSEQRSVRVEFRGFEHDIIGLPFTWRPAGIYQGWLPAVQGGRGAVSVGLVLIGIEHLNFVLLHEVDAAIAILLARRAG